MSEQLSIVMLLGKSGSGKNTAGQWIVDEVGGATLAFGDRLKTICMGLFELSLEDCFTEEGKRRATSFMRQRQNGLEPLPWTVREILQHVGTEGFRAVDPDVWVRCALCEARRLLVVEPYRAVNRVVVLTDGRFRSEVAGVRAVGGEVWRVRRPDLVTPGIVGHVSETEQDSIADDDCDVVVENDGSLEVFRGRVLDALDGWRRRRP